MQTHGNSPGASRRRVSTGNELADTERPRAEGFDPVLELFAICTELSEAKRQEPDDSILSRLLQGEVDGKPVTQEQINLFFMTMAIAGHETTRSTATHFVRLMNDHPEQYELLCSDLDRYLPNAIEEVLRHSPPVIKFRRTVVEDTVIGDQPVKKGDKVYLSYPAANRDPSIFDEPHKFNIERSNATKHLAFGTGPHVCLGARLARLQLQSLLRQVALRIPDIRPSKQTSMLRSIWFNAIIDMPVEFTPEN